MLKIFLNYFNCYTAHEPLFTKGASYGHEWIEGCIYPTWAWKEQHWGSLKKRRQIREKVTEEAWWKREGNKGHTAGWREKELDFGLAFCHTCKHHHKSGPESTTLPVNCFKMEYPFQSLEYHGWIAQKIYSSYTYTPTLRTKQVSHDNYRLGGKRRYT